MRKSFIVIAGMMYACFAQKSTVPSRGSTDTRLDQLYEEILQKLPNDVRQEIDAADVQEHHETKKENRAGRDEKGIIEINPNERFSSDAREYLGELPEQTRERIQSALQEIEDEKMKRINEFREKGRNR